MIYKANGSVIFLLEIKQNLWVMIHLYVISQNFNQYAGPKSSELEMVGGNFQTVDRWSFFLVT